MEASTGIEPVYTDLQSAASPLRQLADLVVAAGYTKPDDRARRGLIRFSASTIAVSLALWHWLDCNRTEQQSLDRDRLRPTTHNDGRYSSETVRRH